MALAIIMAWSRLSIWQGPREIEGYRRLVGKYADMIATVTVFVWFVMSLIKKNAQTDSNNLVRMGLPWMRPCSNMTLICYRVTNAFSRTVGHCSGWNYEVYPRDLRKIRRHFAAVTPPTVTWHIVWKA